MSGTGSLMIRNLRKPADYQKAVMTQDQLLKIAVSNDANIASARKAYKQGEIPPLTQEQGASAVELQEDTGKNESDALNNLLSMGFRYDSASDIVAQLGHDERVIFNNVFPDIKNDFTKRFVVARTTPTAFVEYLRKFIEVFNATKGVSNPAGLFNDKFDALINNIQDLRAIIPDRRQILNIERMVNNLPIGAEIRDMLEGLRRQLPDEAFFRALDQENAFDRARDLTTLQNLLVNLPTRDEFQSVMTDLQQGKLTQQEAIEEIRDLVAGIDINTIEGLELLQEQAKKKASSAGAINIQYSIPVPVEAIQGLGYGSPATTTGSSTGKGSLYALDRDGNPLGVFSNTDYNTLYRDDPQFKAWVNSQFRRKPSYTDLIEFVKSGGGAGGASSVSVISGATDTETSKSGLGIKKKKIGKGIQVEEAPTYRQFGKYVIHQNQLLNNDMLNVKYPSLGRIPQFKPTAISDGTKEFILDLLDNGKANSRVYDTLPIHERKLFEKIATGAGVFSHLKLKKTTTDDEHKDYERFQVLKGEYLAGNNSQALMKELRRLIVKFMNDGKIHKSEGTNLLMDLSI